MKLQYVVILHFGLLLMALNGFAQKNSITADSNALNEALLIKEQQQITIDSLVKRQLQKELNNALGNTKRTEQLAKQLKELSTADSLRIVAKRQKLANLKKVAKPHPVTLLNDTLFNIYTSLSSFTAQERANAITKKIGRLYKDTFYQPDSLKLIKNEYGYDISYKRQEVIASIADLDGMWFNKTNENLAKEYLVVIKQHISKQREAHSLQNSVMQIGQALLILLLLLTIIWMINRVFRRIAIGIRKNREKYLRGLKLRKFKIITASHIEDSLLRINTVIKFVAIVFVTYLSLPLLFSIFPETESWTDTLINWILSPLRSAAIGIIDYLPNLIKIVIIYFLFYYILKAVRFLFYEVKLGNIQFRGFHPEWAIPTFNILKIILYAFMLVIVFPYLPGSGSPAFQGISVFLGVLISLGSSSAISNIVAGLVITYMRPFKVGDRVKIGTVIGDITEKSMLVTRVRTIKNEDVTVPNSMVLSSSTVNYSSQTKEEKQGLILHYTVTISYSAAWQNVYDLLIKAALRTPYIMQTPAPFVLQLSLDEYFISYQINAYTQEANLQDEIYSHLLENIQDEFAKAGVELASPSLHILKKNGSESTGL